MIMNKWIKTVDELPTSLDHEHVDCYIFISGQVDERPFNTMHQCWDTKDYDDYEFDATKPTHWMISPPYPAPPTDI